MHTVELARQNLEEVFPEHSAYAGEQQGVDAVFLE